MTPSLVVLQGPSASGKSTIQSMLGLPRLVTWTSRDPRLGEIDGIDYFFMSKPDMQKLYDQGRMIEMTEYHGHFYGMPAQLVERIIEKKELRSVILDEVGAQKVKQWFSSAALLIGIKAERHECARRLEQRGHTMSEIVKRLSSYELEVKALSQCDLILNNSDENQEKIENVIRFLREGLRMSHDELR